MMAVVPVHAVGRSPVAHAVTAQRTPTSPVQLRAAIAAAYHRELGVEAAPMTLDVLTAHVSHETGRGEQMFNHNFGGIQGAGPSGASAYYRTWEVDADGQERQGIDGFRAYGALHEGATDYVRTLRSRYGAAWAAAVRGDVDGFASALKRQGYFTAHLEAYAASLKGLSQDPQGVGRVVGALSSARLDPVWTTPSDPTAYATEGVVGRVLDAVASMGARVGAPLT